MLKIQRSSNGQAVFTLNGQIDEEHIAELETYIRAKANVQSIVLDLKDVTLANRDAGDNLPAREHQITPCRYPPSHMRVKLTLDERSKTPN